MTATRPAILIAPSILSASWESMGEVITTLADAGVDRIHWDVMDGNFVPEITFGAQMIASCRPLVDLPFEVHLMVQHPDDHLTKYRDAGCDLLIVHAETCQHLHRTLSVIHELGCRAGVALNPSTSLTTIENVMDLADVILIMTVNPGYGGQKFLTSMEAKISAATALRDLSNPECRIEVDGGVGPSTLKAVRECGADIVVSGSAVTSNPSGPHSAIAELRKIAREAVI